MLTLLPRMTVALTSHRLTSSPHCHRQVHLHLAPTEILSDTDQKLALSVFAFASTHIGMSAVRTKIIGGLGKIADSLSLVGNEDWVLPPLWQAFGDGNDTVFPTEEVAGRQLYRIFYTLVSFATLGSSIGYYLQSHHCIPEMTLSDTNMPSNDGYFWTAVAATTAAIASLANASPLGLMPGFQKVTDDNSVLAVQRDDSLKFQARGLTRITRHPLILPVAPWGISNAVLLGDDDASWILFGGLAIYSIAGCWAQDLRVSRGEGSVGTTFGDFDRLQEFFDSTSFLPFGAVVRGKQSMEDILIEVPFVAFLLGLPIAYVVEIALIQWLSSTSCNSG